MQAAATWAYGRNVALHVRRVKGVSNLEVMNINYMQAGGIRGNSTRGSSTQVCFFLFESAAGLFSDSSVSFVWQVVISIETCSILWFNTSTI
jgi:hypothetical protein